MASSEGLITGDYDNRHVREGFVGRLQVVDVSWLPLFHSFLRMSLAGGVD